MEDVAFEESVLVVAHPDDEVLWFSSIVGRVSRVIICFSDYPLDAQLGDNRRKAIQELPFRNVESLNITEACSFLRADWPNPALNQWGFQIRSPDATVEAYTRNHLELVSRLRVLLARYKTVFTHNPWGEYGHEDHGLVHAAVVAARRELGFSLYFSNYASQRNAMLFSDTLHALDRRYLTLHTDISNARKAESIYRKYNCWTWFDGYDWPAQECFLQYSAADDAPQPRTAFDIPINFLCVDLPVKRLGNNVLLRATDRLRTKMSRKVTKIFGA